MGKITCYFCGQDGYSKKGEHYFPMWTRKIVPLSTIRGRYYTRGEFKKYANGATGTETLRDVCEKCNTGWMSKLQVAVRPIIEPWLTAERPFIDKDAALILAQWCVMTALSMDGYDPDFSAVPIPDRRAFAETQQIPPGWLVYVSKHEGGFERGWRRIGISSDSEERPTGQATIFSIGRLLVITMSARPGALLPLSMMKHGVYRIHPMPDPTINTSSRSVPLSTDLRELPGRMLGQYTGPPLLAPPPRRRA